MAYLHHYQFIEKENQKIIGNTYLIRKQYFYGNRMQTTVFIAKLIDIKYNKDITHNHSLIHYYYFDYCYEIYNNAMLLSEHYKIPYTVSYVPDCSHINLFPTQFYKKIPICASLRKEIHTYSFKKVKNEFEKKTRIPESLLTCLIEEYL
uniref:Uncharacterized protein n=1 Tax=viral metagenome TaxID=1070528 RepID=A0A6C0B167_9ZZZZ